MRLIPDVLKKQSNAPDKHGKNVKPSNKRFAQLRVAGCAAT
jgi:hypothetical protein